MTWQTGDEAICVGLGGLLAWDSGAGPAIGSHLTVNQILENPANGLLHLGFKGWADYLLYDARDFTKLSDFKPDAEDLETIKLYTKLPVHTS